MSWLKEVLVDIGVTVFVVMSVYFEHSWMEWIVWIYTALMLFLKGVVLTGDGMSQLMKKSRTSAPEWFSHLLYAVNTGVLLYGGWWYTAIGWILIWLFSFIAHRRMNAGQTA